MLHSLVSLPPLLSALFAVTVGSERAYFPLSVQAITDQLPLDAGDPLFGEVLVVVLNNKPGTHAVFDELRTKIMAGPHALYFKFVEQEIQQTDNVHNPEHSANVPSSNVRRQTRAVISTLRASAGQGRYFLFMEDDFVVCPHALRAMSYITNKANAYYPRGWSGIRVSHGLCGILINDADVPEVANYLEQHQVLPWFPGPCSPTVFRSVICDCLSLNGFFSLPGAAPAGPSAARVDPRGARAGCGVPPGAH
jgi:hypothetical protein